MYSNKENVNILTALLVAHGVRHAVVCPGSRNAPIVHNFHECPDIQCHPVTDERSAGFYALGMALCTCEPVVVCVTSGTALLNLAPAVAEAYYQHVSLVVVSADRPPQWIDQLDGQTLPQPDALGRFVRKAVSLPEPHDPEEHWYCNRLICEALTEDLNEDLDRGGGPVHINVPISEPLFQFDVKELPREAIFSRWDGSVGYLDIENSGLLAEFWGAKRPMIVIGQNRETVLKDHELEHLRKHAVLLYEPLGSDLGTTHFDEVLYAKGEDESLQPDFVLYGGTIVSKRLKKFLRKDTHADFWEISADGQLHDTFMRTKGVMKSTFLTMLLWLDNYLGNPTLIEEYNEDAEEPLGALVDKSEYVLRWQKELECVTVVTETYSPPYSQMAVVKDFEQQLGDSDITWNLFSANSMAVRLSCIYSSGYVYCNRGVNGIDGSLSTVAGFSLVAKNPTFIVIGDLSFFYDQNALWNQDLNGKLRILLLNNGCGGIFNMLLGLEQSPARDKYVAAEHQTTAEGICQQNRVAYRQAVDMASMQQGIRWLLQAESQRPLLLEVITDAAADVRAFKQYYQTVAHSMEREKPKK